MPRLSQNGIGESVRIGVHWVASIWFRGVFYGRTLRGRRPQALTMIPEENWPGSSDRGAGLVDGRFQFLNHSVSAEDLAAGRSDTGLHGKERSMRRRLAAVGLLVVVALGGELSAQQQGPGRYCGVDWRCTVSSSLATSYAGMPAWYVNVAVVAEPKSHSRQRPSAVERMKFSGLMSRCATGGD